MLPGIDGWQVCREIRKKSKVPIIMISAKGETIDKVIGLELGADNYLVKPFEAKELIARIHAVLRRYEGKEESKRSPSNGREIWVRNRSFQKDLRDVRFRKADGGDHQGALPWCGYIDS